jgi:hypothetical protein
VHHLNSCIVFRSCLQAAEFHLIELFEMANLCAIHAKRVTISKLSLSELLFLCSITPNDMCDAFWLHNSLVILLQMDMINLDVILKWRIAYERK